jgi:1-aminocyclopropane-1-carboxylate deaminase
LSTINFNSEVSPILQIFDKLFDEKQVNVFVKRDDLLHPTIMGNKWRKLKYNLLEAKKQGFKSLLTFGGAFSNHIYAVASAGNEFDFETIGIIRGNELNSESNPTLKYASSMGMRLVFVGRPEYLEKEKLAIRFGNGAYILPEGGTNELAIKGCAEIMDELENQINASHVCVAIGTGGTFGGIVAAEKENIKIIGLPVLKGFGIDSIDIPQFDFSEFSNFDIWPDFHFGGYGKTTKELIDFMQKFENEHNIPLEQVYNAKLFYGVFDKIKYDYFPKNSKIVMVHTGGLQGRMK